MSHVSTESWERLIGPNSANASEIISKCVELCEAFNLTPEKLEGKWRYFRGQKELKEKFLSVELCEKLMESIRASSVSSAMKPKVMDKNSLTRVQVIPKMKSDVESKYGVVIKQEVKSEYIMQNNTPDRRVKSEGILSPYVQASQNSRENRNKIEISYPESIESHYRVEVDEDSLKLTAPVHSCERIDIEKFDSEEESNSSYRYMYQDLNHTAAEMSNEMRSLALQIAEANMIDPDNFSCCDIPTDSEVFVYGRIIADSADGKINAASIMLEGDDSISMGRSVKLDVSEMEEFSLFPGQIVVINGLNSTGRKLVAKKIFTGTKLSAAKTAESLLESYSTPFTVLAAAGPFHLCPAVANNSGKPNLQSSLTWDLLADLLRVVKLQKPDVLILMGPFLDAEASIMRYISTPYSEIFSQMMSYLIDEVPLSTSIVLIPSTRDITHHPVFPQPEFSDSFILPILQKRALNLGVSAGNRGFKELQEIAKMYLCPNPCSLRVNDIVFGITTEDIFFDISKNLAFLGKQDRLSANYLFDQQSFYPKYPSDIKTPIDYTHYENLYFKSCSPDILITPSKLPRFVKSSDSQLCVNPERLVKSENPGTFAFFTIHPLATTSLDAQDAQVASFDRNNEAHFYHNAASRTKVDIVRI